MMVKGFHHITAITAEPKENIGFYTNVLGQRLVKKTVNFDDPTSYHLYYGNETGEPGTILTFFVWPHLPRGESGKGQATCLAYSIPRGSRRYWIDRLDRHGIPFKDIDGELGFHDPEGLCIRLAEDDSPIRPARSAIPETHAIRGFRSVILSSARQGTSQVLRLLHVDETSVGFQDSPAQGILGAGTIHHIAFDAGTSSMQMDMSRLLEDRGLAPTPQIDRKYFTSVYFREPGGILFELATSGPGMMIDESESELGKNLVLPPWLEPSRATIEQALPEI